MSSLYIWVGQDKQGIYKIEESGQRAQSNPKRRGQDVCICEVLHEVAAQVCTYKAYIGIMLLFI
jgi:hypothetical protein